MLEVKKYRLYILLLSFLSLSSCDGYPVTFTQKTEFTFPKQPANRAIVGLERLTQKIFQIKIDGKKTLREKNLSEDAIRSIYLKTLQLNIKPDSEGQNLSFLESVEFYAEAPNLPTILIARLDGSVSEKMTTLIIKDQDLKPYLIADFVKIFAKATGRLPDQETKIAAVFNLETNIDLAVACQER